MIRISSSPPPLSLPEAFLYISRTTLSFILTTSLPEPSHVSCPFHRVRPQECPARMSPTCCSRREPHPPPLDVHDLKPSSFTLLRSCIHVMPISTLPKVLFVGYPTFASADYIKSVEDKIDLTVRPLP